MLKHLDRIITNKVIQNTRIIMTDSGSSGDSTFNPDDVCRLW